MDPSTGMMPGMAAHSMSPPQDLLCMAIKQGETEQAKQLVAQFPEALNAVDTMDGATAAHWAALFGNVELLELFSVLIGKNPRSFPTQCLFLNLNSIF